MLGQTKEKGEKEPFIPGFLVRWVGGEHSPSHDISYRDAGRRETHLNKLNSLSSEKKESPTPRDGRFLSLPGYIPTY